MQHRPNRGTDPQHPHIPRDVQQDHRQLREQPPRVVRQRVQFAGREHPRKLLGALDRADVRVVGGVVGQGKVVGGGADLARVVAGQ